MAQWLGAPTVPSALAEGPVLVSVDGSTGHVTATWTNPRASGHG
jgi:hypothetical protein